MYLQEISTVPLLSAAEEVALAKAIEEATEALQRLLTAPELRAELRARGLARARQFTWEAAARKTLAVYQAVSRTPTGD